MRLLSEIFTWWNGQTLTTRLLTARSGERVGEDTAGNVYYQSRDKVRRWVIFANQSEASSVTAEWHGWLHHTFENPPTEEPMTRRTWEKPHEPNKTGTDAAYHPPGSIRAPRPERPSDYDAWVPEG